MTSLRAERRLAGVSLDAVGQFFRGGVTRERIRQIEVKKNPSALIINDFRSALASAISHRARIDKALAKALSELNGSPTVCDSQNAKGPKLRK
ncbi:MAG: hypothetical protein ACRD4S_01705 [Candidatus Acidiferrales bacterium]